MMYKKKLLRRICDKGNPLQNSGTIGSIICDKNQQKLKSIQKPEQQVIRSSQKRHFSDETKTLESNESLKNLIHTLMKMDWISELWEKTWSIYFSYQNIILSKLLIKWCHEKVGHSGGGITMNQIRSSGY